MLILVKYCISQPSRSWTYISNWYSDLAAAKSAPNFEVKETVAELFEGKRKSH